MSTRRENVMKKKKKWNLCVEVLRPYPNFSGGYHSSLRTYIIAEPKSLITLRMPPLVVIYYIKVTIFIVLLRQSGPPKKTATKRFFFCLARESSPRHPACKTSVIRTRHRCWLLDSYFIWYFQNTKKKRHYLFPMLIRFKMRMHFFFLFNVKPVLSITERR